MLTAIDRAVHDAVVVGWRIKSVHQSQAVLYHPGRESSVAATALNAILTMITCGLWLIPWLLIELVNHCDQPQTLIICEIDGRIERKVIRT